MKTNTWRTSLASLIALIAIAVTVGCGPGPKSQQLADLERQLQDPSASEVKDDPGASKPYREARQYRRLSLEAWDEGKEDVSEEYAVLGMLRYRTAVAISEQHEAKARLDAANAQVGDANPEIRALNQEQIKLADEVATLEQQVAQARRAKEEADRRATALKSQQAVGQSGQQDAALETKVRNKLNEVRAAKQAADAVNAGTHAPASYNPAANSLKGVEAQVTGNRVTNNTFDEANQTLVMFQKAAAEAKPLFEQEQEKQNPALRRQRLLAEAQAAFGGPYVVAEPAGTRVVLAGAFLKHQTTVDAAATRQLDELAKLANKYDEFAIRIEGYTSKGDATENLGISQLRARTVKDFLESKGVNGTRIDTKGQGQDRPRFPGDPSKDERVEVVLTR